MWVSTPEVMALLSCPASSAPAPLRRPCTATMPDDQIEALSQTLDTMWLLLCGFGVFSMQAGFALVEAGAVVANLRSILMKNMIDVCICTLGWYAVGYGLASGRFSTVSCPP